MYVHGYDEKKNRSQVRAAHTARAKWYEKSEVNGNDNGFSGQGPACLGRSVGRSLCTKGWRQRKTQNYTSMTEQVRQQ